MEREIQRTGQQVVRAGLPAVPVAVAAAKRAAPVVGAALLSAAYLAAAGGLAYAATTAIMQGKAEADTIENSVAKARSMAASAFYRKFGRFPTHAEYADLRKRIGNSVADAVKAMSGSIPAKWRLFIQFLKGE